jgi:hypothetical protein
MTVAFTTIASTKAPVYAEQRRLLDSGAGGINISRAGSGV